MISPLHCAQILASVDDSASGPSYSVSRLSAQLQREGAAVSILTVAGWRQVDGAMPAGESAVRHNTYPHDFAGVPGLSRLCFSGGLRQALQRMPGSNILHTHGLWLMPNVYPAWVAQANGSAFMISPRGMFAPAALRFSRLKKAAFWYLLQRAAVAKARCLHATSEQEYREIRAFGLTNPVAVIPNGVDLPQFTGDAAKTDVGRVVLSLGRIHPKKGLDSLVAAWARVEPRFPDWRLRIVGPDEVGYAQKLKRLAAELQLARVSFDPPLYNDAKHAALRAADLFVLPTLNENFGLVVAESLAAETPVIATKGAPWSGLSRHGCGWWIDAGPEALAATLTDAMTAPRQALKDMGAKGRAWMAQAFSWQKAAADMLEVYRWLADDGGAVPSTVRLV